MRSPSKPGSANTRDTRPACQSHHEIRPRAVSRALFGACIPSCKRRRPRDWWSQSWCMDRWKGISRLWRAHPNIHVHNQQPRVSSSGCVWFFNSLSFWSRRRRSHYIGALQQSRADSFCLLLLGCRGRPRADLLLYLFVELYIGAHYHFNSISQVVRMGH